MNGTEEITNQQLNDVFEFVNAHDPTFKERYTREGWEEKIRRDEEYRKKTYEWIKNTERILDKKSEKEGKQKGSLYNKVAGTYESFSKSFDPIDVKKKLDSESQDISLKGTTESVLETPSSESSENQPSEVVNEFVSTFNEDEFQEWWNTNPNILQWKQDYINSYGTEPVLGEVMMDIPDWYDFRAAYNSGITPQQNVNKKYYWGYDSPTGEVIKISEGAEWKRKFEEDTGESPPEGMSMEEANSTYYNEGSDKYILQGVRGTAINFDSGVQPSAYLGEYGSGIEDKVGREFYAFFQQDGKKLNMTTQEMQKALDAQSLEEWDKLIDYDTMVDIFLQKEEIAAPLLEKMFLDYGFEVGQRHWGNDRIEIIAPNGKSITLSTDQDDKKWYDKSHTHSASHNAKRAINFLNKNKGKRSYVHDTQRYEDAQNIEFRRDWNEHTNEASQFRKNLREYNKLNTTYSNYPRSKRKEDRYIKLK